MKSKVAKLDVDKLLPVPVDLSISGVAKNVVKKDVHNAKIKNIENKILDITNLATKTILNAKINEFKGGIPNITNLGSKIAVNAIENKISSIINFVKKLPMTQQLKKLKRILRIIILINILLLHNLISSQQKQENKKH